MVSTGQPQQQSSVGTGTGETPRPAAAPATGETPNADEHAEPPTFDEWFAAIDATGKHLVTSHVASLRGALDVERNERKTLARQLKELSGKLEGEAAEQINAMRQQMETTTRRAEFVEEAALAGCALPRQAWHIAQAEGLTVAQMRSQYPQLFNVATQKAPGGAGAGTAAPPAVRASMDDFIRRAAGRGG